MNLAACPSCDQQLSYTPRQAGKTVQCPKCEVRMILPGPSTAGHPTKGSRIDPLGGSPVNPQTPTGKPSAQQPSPPQLQPQSTSSFAETNQLPTNPYMGHPNPGSQAHPGTQAQSGTQARPGSQAHSGFQTRPSQKPIPGKMPKLPKGFKVEQSPNQLSMVTPGSLSQFGTFGFVALFMVLCSSVTLPIILGAMIGPSVFSAILVFVLAPCGFLGVIYLIVATIMNRKVVEVTPDHIKVKVKGPLPVPHLATTVPTRSVQQIYVVRRTYFKTINHGMDSISEVASTAMAVHDGMQNGWEHYSYHVFALLENGWRKELSGGDIGPKGARFLEKSVERFLGIRDQPVVSTWYQSLFYRENTLDEESKNFSGDGLRAKCLWLPMAYSIFGAFALLVFILVVAGMLFAALAFNNPNDRYARNGSPGSTGEPVAVQRDSVSAVQKNQELGDGWTRTVVEGVNKFQKISFGNDQMIAVGEPAVIASSRNGLEWQRTMFSFEDKFSTICFGNGVWVAGGSWYPTPHLLLYSTDDGQSWKAANAKDHYGVNGVVRDGKQFYAVTFQGYVMQSSDGANWKDLGNSIRATAYDIALGPNGVAIAGYKGKVGFASRIQGPWSTEKRGNSSLSAVAYGNETFIIVGPDGQAFSRQDTRTPWQTCETGTTNGLRDIAFINGNFYVVGANGTLLITKRGQNWTKVDLRLKDGLNGIGSDGKKIYIVGDNGLILSRQLEKP